LRLVDSDDTFKAYPLLKQELEKRQKQRIHFE
jgi:hypothetical protein